MVKRFSPCKSGLTFWIIVRGEVPEITKSESFKKLQLRFDACYVSGWGYQILRHLGILCSAWIHCISTGSYSDYLRTQTQESKRAFYLVEKSSWKYKFLNFFSIFNLIFEFFVNVGQFKKSCVGKKELKNEFVRITQKLFSWGAKEMTARFCRWKIRLKKSQVWIMSSRLKFVGPFPGVTRRRRWRKKHWRTL